MYKSHGTGQKDMFSPGPPRLNILNLFNPLNSCSCNDIYSSMSLIHLHLFMNLRNCIFIQRKFILFIYLICFVENKFVKHSYGTFHCPCSIFSLFVLVTNFMIFMKLYLCRSCFNLNSLNISHLSLK